MTDKRLTQAEADALLAMEKHRKDDTEWDYSGLGKLVITLVSADGRESFFLDLWRNKLNLRRGKYQNRARENQVLARLDFGGPPHRNPDGKEVKAPHLHLYIEGFADSWAYPVPSKHFSNISDLQLTLEEFMRYCNITKPPNIQRGLFT